VVIIQTNITVIVIVNAIFASVTMSVMFKSFWCVVLASTKMMEPFYQLSRSGGVSAKEALLTHYVGAGTAWRAFDPRNKRWLMLLTTIISVLLSAMASLGSETMSVRAGSTCNNNGGRRLCDPQWVMNMVVLRCVQAVLALTAALIALMIYTGWGRRSGLGDYPCSIISMTDVLRHSDEALVNDLREIDPDATDEEVAKALAGKTYTLKSIETLSGKLRCAISCNNEVQPPQRRGTILEEATKTAQPTHRKPKAWYKRIPYCHIFHASLHIFMFVLILLFTLFGNDTYLIYLTNASGSGSALVSLPFKFLDGTQFGPRFFLSIVTILISRYWEDVEAGVRLLCPYRRLSKQSLSQKELEKMKLHGVPFTMVVHALRAGNWFHAFISLIAISSYALIILVVGVPFNYGQVKDLNLISSAASVGILGMMLLALVGVWVWKRSGPQMPREPNSLVNVWLLLCASRMLEEDMSCHDTRKEKRRYWFRRAVGMDGVERWMVDKEVKDEKGLSKGAR
jgi:hypothetical protein